MELTNEQFLSLTEIDIILFELLDVPFRLGSQEPDGEGLYQISVKFNILDKLNNLSEENITIIFSNLIQCMQQQFGYCLDYIIELIEDTLDRLNEQSQTKVDDRVYDILTNILSEQIDDYNITRLFLFTEVQEH